MLDYQASKKAAETPRKTSSEPRRQAPAKRKLTYKEQKEMEQLEADIEALGAEKASLEEELSSGTLPYDRLEAASSRHAEVCSLLDEKELRWLELSEI
jgi:ATP-binding cassette subfamily F protein uup